MKCRRMGRAGLRDKLIGGHGVFSFHRPFLQFGFGIDRRSGLCVKACAPQAQNNFCRRCQSAIQIYRAQHGFASICQNIARRRVAATALAWVAADHGIQIDLGGNFGTNAPAHQFRQPTREIALFFVRVARQQFFGNHQTQHPVAQKFQMLIIVVDVQTCVAQCATQKRVICEAIVQIGQKLPERGVHQLTASSKRE